MIRRYPPPGQLVNLPNGEKIHVYRQGNPGNPTIVFEAGIAGSCLGWSLVQPLVGQFAHAVSYDRVGLGWSSALFKPRTVANMVDELSATLQAGDVEPPYVLVGHSFGGLLVQAFTHTHPGEVSAVVMIDPVTQLGWADADHEQLRRLRNGVRLSRRGAVLARFGIVRAALSVLLSGGTRIPKLLARASAGQGNGVIERLIGEVRKLPPEAQPIIAAHWSRAQSFIAMAAYLECLPASARLALTMPIPPHIPLTILSAGSATYAELAEREAWIAVNHDSRHKQIPGTGHWLQLEKPELVASVIRDVLR